MNDFKTRLKLAMNQKGMNAATLAETTGLSRGAISNYLKGRYKPAQANTYKIAVALDINPAWLMGKMPEHTEPLAHVFPSKLFIEKQKQIERVTEYFNLLSKPQQDSIIELLKTMVNEEEK